MCLCVCVLACLRAFVCERKWGQPQEHAVGRARAFVRVCVCRARVQRRSTHGAISRGAVGSASGSAATVSSVNSASDIFVPFFPLPMALYSLFCFGFVLVTRSHERVEPWRRAFAEYSPNPMAHHYSARLASPSTIHKNRTRILSRVSAP